MRIGPQARTRVVEEYASSIHSAVVVEPYRSASMGCLDQSNQTWGDMRRQFVMKLVVTTAREHNTNDVSQRMRCTTEPAHLGVSVEHPTNQSCVNSASTRSEEQEVERLLLYTKTTIAGGVCLDGML